MTNNTYKEFSVNSLNEGLLKLREGVSGSAEPAISYSSWNMIVIFSATVSDEEIEETIDALTLVRPARFFVICLYDNTVEVEFNVSARCYLLSKDEHVCSEIIKINATESDCEQVAGLIRGHQLTGVGTDSLIFSTGHISNTVLTTLVSLSDRVIFDSARSVSIQEPLFFTTLTKESIDLEWLRISPWRGIVKNAFDLPDIAKELSRLNKITINVGTKFENSLSCYLLGSWILKCLNFEVTALGGYGFECKSFDGRIIKLDLIKDDSTNNLNHIGFEFNDLSQVSKLVISRKDKHLQAVVESATNNKLDKNSCAVVPISDDKDIDVLEQFFLAGASSRDYDKSLRVAVDMVTLSSGHKFI